MAYEQEKRREELLSGDQHELRAAMGLQVSIQCNVPKDVTLFRIALMQAGVVLPGIDELNAKEKHGLRPTITLMRMGF